MSGWEHRAAGQTIFAGKVSENPIYLRNYLWELYVNIVIVCFWKGRKQGLLYLMMRLLLPIVVKEISAC